MTYILFSYFIAIDLIRNPLLYITEDNYTLKYLASTGDVIDRRKY